ncbi:LAME_0C04720g1_1 [Lachancea meyersii CBS 8951]|uniref:LAME_0C04720g1_1 n=1 Tax=Lachancea meyersii CBS 8951 TaxID=1266667 RepID=A0A1G4J171_9SACH|nr:LAME_0C04720g1_1 [Lachancea meyersii CBS 8951]
MANGCTLHVSGFPRGVRTRDLAPDFESAGRVVRIEMPPARSEFARPYAFVEYETAEEAQDALHQLDQRPLSFDPQISITVQLARSEARPSRFARGPDRNFDQRGPMRKEPRRSIDYPRGPRGYEAGPEEHDHYGHDDFRDRSRDEFRHRRPDSEDMYHSSRGSFGSRSHRSYRRPEHAMLRRELSPARVRADDGPAPYQDVLHNNAAALKKPRYEGSREKQEELDQYYPVGLQSNDVDMSEQPNETAAQAPSEPGQNSVGTTSQNASGASHAPGIEQPVTSLIHPPPPAHLADSSSSKAPKTSSPGEPNTVVITDNAITNNGQVPPASNANESTETAHAVEVQTKASSDDKATESAV